MYSLYSDFANCARDVFIAEENPGPYTAFHCQVP